MRDSIKRGREKERYSIKRGRERLDKERERKRGRESDGCLGTF